MLRLFLRFFDLEWSVAERKTEKSRRRFWGLTANLQGDTPRDSYSQECYADVFCYRKALCSGTDPSSPGDPCFLSKSPYFSTISKEVNPIISSSVYCDFPQPEKQSAIITITVNNK